VSWDKRPVPHGWEYTSSFGVTIRLDRLVYTSRGLTAWVELHHKDVPVADGRAPGVYGQWNLLSSTTVPAITKRWDQWLGVGGDDDRKGLIGDFVNDVIYDVIGMWREGPDPVDLAAAPANDGGWLLEPWVEQSSHSRLIARGGAGKSYLALAMALTVATGERFFPDNGRYPKPTKVGPVAYLDWESDAGTHQRRMRQLLDGAGLDPIQLGLISYFPMRGPLHRQTIGVQRRLEHEGAVMVIVDSVMLARGSSGEGGAEDTTVRMFEALDELAVPCLLIDHKSKQQVKSQSGLGGYGSVVMTNSVRNEWDAFRVYHSDEGIRLGLKHTKQNNTRPYADLVLTVSFDGSGPVRLVADRKLVEDTDMPVVDQIAIALTGRPATVADLADELGRPGDTIRKTLRRHTDRFGELGGTPPRWCNSDEADEYGRLPGPF
jgi:hypothetical protein